TTVANVPPGCLRSDFATSTAHRNQEAHAAASSGEEGEGGEDGDGGLPRRAGRAADARPRHQDGRPRRGAKEGFPRPRGADGYPHQDNPARADCPPASAAVHSPDGFRVDRGYPDRRGDWQDGVLATPDADASGIVLSSGTAMPSLQG